MLSLQDTYSFTRWVDSEFHIDFSCPWRVNRVKSLTGKALLANDSYGVFLLVDLSSELMTLLV